MTQADTAPEKNSTPFPTSKDNPRDEKLDSALEDTFPASDPVSVSTAKPEPPNGSHAKNQGPDSAKEQEAVPEESTLDEAIKESFPASDPVSVSTEKPDDTQS
ncbi:hypothetical protein [Parapusillimonas granuli]|uniref:Uncharacterized protein n=1 Tax=Parapusillimonas granuli TaxID=380911 RepID=A0A853FXX7_9BURK|nr:hypothetical protein [Parapusillimonas granuli]MBB5213695.1 hypothetical protein [Parapusillimonas granuli]NYT48532.1 hypothetical protein [Parapusillimonas granuli]